MKFDFRHWAARRNQVPRGYQTGDIETHISFEGKSVSEALDELQQALAPTPIPWWVIALAPFLTFAASHTGWYWYYGRDHKLHWYRDEPQEESKMEAITCATCGTTTMILVRSFENTFWCPVCRTWKPCPELPTGNALANLKGKS